MTRNMKSKSKSKEGPKKSSTKTSSNGTKALRVKTKRNSLLKQAPIDLDEFQSKVLVRTWQIEDYDRLVDLQKACFPGMTPWSREQIERQLEIFPQGQFCVEYDGEVVASASSLIVDFEEYESSSTWHEVADRGFIKNHDQEGDTLYGIEMMVDPEYRGMKLARRLYEARKELVQELNLRRILIGGRIPGYEAHRDEMTVGQYVERIKDRSLSDSVLTVQLANGFTLKRVVPQSSETNDDSQGFATLLEWINLDHSADRVKKILFSNRVRVSLVQYQLRTIRGFDEFERQCEYFVDVASNYKSDFVVFPEIFTMQLLSFANSKSPARAVRKLASFTPVYIKLFADLAIKYNVNIIGGSHFTLEDEALRNVAYLFMRDGSIGKQYKLHITPSERRWWGVKPGNRVEVFHTDKGKIAILICYDVEFPELARLAVEKGAEIIFVPFCTDDRQAYLRVRYCSQARAIENQVYICTAGTVGNLPFVENMDIHYAQSGIYTPSDFSFPRDGIAAETSPNIETVMVNDIDLALLKRSRRTGSVTNWADRRSDLYTIQWSEPESDQG